MKKRELWKNVLLLVAVSITCLAVLEIALRAVGSTNADNGFVFRVDIKPYSLPVHELEQLTARYHASKNPYLVTDAQLGWTIRPNATYSTLYQANSEGIRGPKEYARTPTPGVLRIALFGDSFTHGDDVPYNQTWASFLETDLNASGTPSEVINFGVGGYGNDQAYLRWQLVGRTYSPAVVIIGFQPENCMRNVNVVRKFYSRFSDLPFSKPRFVLQNNSLVLENYPTISPDDLPAHVANFPNDPLTALEHFYNPDDYAPKWYLHSRLLGVFLTFLYEIREDQRTTAFYQDGTEGTALCKAIVDQFAADAGKSSRVYIVHLPYQAEISRELNGGHMLDAHLLASLKESHTVIDPAPALLAQARAHTINSLFVAQNGHYAQTANRIVATAITDQLVANATSIS